MKSGITASQFEKRISQDFYILAFEFAGSMVHKNFSEDVAEIVTNTMEDLIGKLRCGIIPFKSGSRFSTFLWGMIRNKVNDKYRIYYPNRIESLGPVACELYKLILIQNVEVKTAITECQQNHSVNFKQLEQWSKIIESFREDSNNRMAKQGNPPPSASYEQIIENTKIKEPEYIEDIHEKLEKQERSIQLRHAVELLNEPEKTAIKGFYYEGKTFKEIEKENTHIKNAQYEVRKGEKQIRKILKIHE